jgi:hypothetical protein
MLNPISCQQKIKLVDSSMTIDLDRVNPARGNNKASGTANSHRGENMRRVASHHLSAILSISQALSTTTKYAE